MICLNELWAENFLSWSNLHLNLDDIGMLLITGDNGSGKSSIPSAVTWALYGRTIKGLQTDEVIQWDKDQCKVSLKLEVDGKPVLITRLRGEKNDIELLVNGKKIGGTNADRQRLINDIIGDFNVCVNTSMFAQGEVNYLTKATDTERKKIFKKVLDYSKLDILYEHVRKKIVDIEDRIRTFTIDNENIEERLEHQISIIDDLEEEAGLFDKEKEERINDYENQLAEEKKLLSKLKRSLSNDKRILKSTEEDMSGEDGQSESTIKSNYSSLRDKKSKIISDLTDAKREISKLASESCPTCGQTWPDIDTRQSRIRKLKKRVKSLASDKEYVENELDVLEGSLSEVEDRRVALTELKAKLKHSQAKVGDKTAMINMLKKSIEKEKKKENTIEDRLIKHKQFLDELRSKFKNNEHKIEKLEKDRIHYNALRTVFSKKGVQSYIAENYFGFLMSVANEYLSVLDPEMSIIISPTRRLKSGEIKEEIDITAKRRNREVPFLALSDGQRQRLNVALLFAMHELSRSRAIADFDTVFLDEVLDISLDQTGQESMAILLKRLQFEHGVSKMVVISHNEELKSWFSERLSVELVGEESRFI